MGSVKYRLSIRALTFYLNGLLVCGESEFIHVDQQRTRFRMRFVVVFCDRQRNTERNMRGGENGRWVGGGGPAMTYEQKLKTSRSSDTLLPNIEASKAPDNTYTPCPFLMTDTYVCHVWWQVKVLKELNILFLVLFMDQLHALAIFPFLILWPFWSLHTSLPTIYYRPYIGRGLLRWPWRVKPIAKRHNTNLSFRICICVVAIAIILWILHLVRL